MSPNPNCPRSGPRLSAICQVNKHCKQTLVQAKSRTPPSSLTITLLLFYLTTVIIPNIQSMLWDVGQPPELLARINRWQEEVVTDTLRFTRQPPAKSYLPHLPHRMNLRSRATRPPLAEVSENPRTRKRKMPASTASKGGRKGAKGAKVDDDEDEVMNENAPRRGRSSKLRDQELVNHPDFDLQMRLEPPPTIWSPSRPGSPRKASTSPSKKQITLDKQISEAAIDMKYLERCDPATHLTKFQDLRLDGTKIPSAVEELFETLEGIPQGLIPSTLEVIFPQ